ncbi:hypothetical protein BGX28_004120 [Mortierella sp. GBA30]|nr:hypothetical protein BGX28_004120 [Mortierella sp. GBA30]
MASNRGSPWPAHSQHPPSNTASAPSAPQAHPQQPNADPYRTSEQASDRSQQPGHYPHPYPHPHPPSYYSHTPAPYHHDPYYPYPPHGSTLYPPSYAHGPPHAYRSGHGSSAQPGYHHAPPPQHIAHDNITSHNNNNTNNGNSNSSAETPSVTATVKSTAKSKAKPASKTKAGKVPSSSTSSEANAASSSSVPKTPKVFRFEGSISSESFKTTKSFDLAGVNILNRKPLDTKTALDKLQRRRETHNRVERKRRDCINQLIDDLTKLLPSKHLDEATSKCHRVNVLRGAVSHIKFLNESNEKLTRSIRSIKGEDPIGADTELVARGTDTGVSDNLATSEDRMSMDIEDEKPVKEDPDRRLSSPSSSSTSPSVSPTISSSASAKRKMVLPPVIVTDAPSPSTERDLSRSMSGIVDIFSLESRPRSNSFTSSIGDQASPRSSFPGSPNFPPSPVSPLPHGQQSLFPPGEGPMDANLGSGRKQLPLSPFMGESPSPSPSLPPISSLAKMQLQSPSGDMGDSVANEGRALPATDQSPATTFSARCHRGAATLPPLTIPEPHHLHPSYHQGTGGTPSSGSGSGSGSNRNSLTLSPHSAEQPPMSPFMLSPLQPRSPSIGPLSSASPGESPHPNWSFHGAPSPQMYPSHGSPFAHPHHCPPSYSYSYTYPSAHTTQTGQHMDPNQSPHQQPTQPHPQAQQQQRPSQGHSDNNNTDHHHARHKSLQPEPIFIQEEPWNVQRKRSTSSASGRVSSRTGAAMNKKKATEAGGSKMTVSQAEGIMSGDKRSSPDSPISSVTSSSMTTFPSSPNPKKRTQFASYDRVEEDDDESSKRSKQVEQVSENGGDGSLAGPLERDSGVMVRVINDSQTEDTKSAVGPDTTAQATDEDAAQALTSLASTTT